MTELHPQYFLKFTFLHTRLSAGRNGAAATAGDLVMIQGLLLQLWAPLQFLGWCVADAACVRQSNRCCLEQGSC